ncbi:MAG: cation:proton antiporter [Actinomycetota bacterium]|nr:cation:proton antiporter [Actinomycetota bacterium]
MGVGVIIYVTAALFLYALVSKRLASSPISGPIVFVTLGLVGYASGILSPIAVLDSPITALLEFTLALLLFTDASKLHLRSREADMALPTRLLGIGMPLTIALGAIVAYLVFPSVGIVGAAIIATILAPTDAALGFAVVANPRVPIRIREALSIESGLNDGIALPILLFLITLAAADAGVPLWNFFVEGIGVAVPVGLVVGVGAALAIRFAVERSWIESQWVRIAMVAVALGAYIVADHLGGSGFIAAYVAGIGFGRVLDRLESSSIDFAKLAEDLGTVLSMTSFLLFGAYLLAPNLAAFTAATVFYAVMSLTVVRMIPVATSMIGTRLASPTLTYLGWFGPRGLASIIFASVLVEEAGLEQARLIVGVIIVTVAASVLLHGVTAPWGANKYAAWYSRRSEATGNSRSVDQ